jgi:hypothetical protein
MALKLLPFGHACGKSPYTSVPPVAAVIILCCVGDRPVPVQLMVLTPPGVPTVPVRHTQLVKSPASKSRFGGHNPACPLAIPVERRNNAIPVIQLVIRGDIQKLAVPNLFKKSEPAKVNLTRGKNMNIKSDCIKDACNLMY